MPDIEKLKNELENLTEKKDNDPAPAAAEDTKAQERVLIDRVLDEKLPDEERLQAAQEALERGFITGGNAYFPFSLTPETALKYANRPPFRAYWYAISNNPKLRHTDDVIRASINRVLGKH
jgi:hypothetical protein